MKNEELMRQFNWKSICEKDCYSPWLHSHEFDRSNAKIVDCKSCNLEMELDAQCYQVEMGKNTRILLNCYNCHKCGLQAESAMEID